MAQNAGAGVAHWDGERSTSRPIAWTGPLRPIADRPACRPTSGPPGLLAGLAGPKS